LTRFRTAVIDSGPLFSALVINYDRQYSFGRSLRYNGVLAPSLRESGVQTRFLNFLSSIPQKLTTAHVISELWRLERSRLKLYGAGWTSFWRTSIDLLTQWAIDERLVRLIDLAANANLRECVTEIGATDAALIQLAEQHGCVLITDDERTLAARAWSRLIDCQLVKQLIVNV
jgi:predicted nucleic acid-binding protein